jgi:hypothetical protein
VSKLRQWAPNKEFDDAPDDLARAVIERELKKQNNAKTGLLL